MAAARVPVSTTGPISAAADYHLPPPARSAPPCSRPQEPFCIGAGDVRTLLRSDAVLGVRPPGAARLLPARTAPGSRRPWLRPGLRAGLRSQGLGVGAAEPWHLRQHSRAADRRAGGARHAAGPQHQALRRAGHSHPGKSGAGVSPWPRPASGVQGPHAADGRPGAGGTADRGGDGEASH